MDMTILKNVGWGIAYLFVAGLSLGRHHSLHPILECHEETLTRSIYQVPIEFLTPEESTIKECMRDGDSREFFAALAFLGWPGYLPISLGLEAAERAFEDE